MNWKDRLRYAIFQKLTAKVTNCYTGNTSTYLYDKGEFFKKNAYNFYWERVRIIRVKNSHTIVSDSFWTHHSNVVPTNLTNIYMVFDEWKKKHHIVINGKVYK